MMTTHTATRPALLAAAAAAVATAAAAPVNAVPSASARFSLGDDAPLFDMIRRWRELDAESKRLNDEIFELGRGLPSLEWSPEERKIHRIRLSLATPVDGNCFVSLKGIEINDELDNPWRVEFDEAEWVDEGAKDVLTITGRRSHVSEDEMKAWSGRCAARRALYDAKLAARNEAADARGLASSLARSESLDREIDGFAESIRAWSPVTIAGAVALLQHIVESFPGRFGRQEMMDWEHLVLLSALASLERLTGAVPVVAAIAERSVVA